MKFTKRILSAIISLLLVVTSFSGVLGVSAATLEDGNLFYGLIASTNNSDAWAVTERKQRKKQWSEQAVAPCSRLFCH